MAMLLALFRSAWSSFSFLSIRNPTDFEGFETK